MHLGTKLLRGGTEFIHTYVKMIHQVRLSIGYSSPDLLTEL